MAYEKNPEEIGALWANEGQKGPYLTGEINGVKVVCFPAKPSERGPAWRVLKSRPRDGQTPSRASEAITRGRHDDDDAIPF